MEIFKSSIHARLIRLIILRKPGGEQEERGHSREDNNLRFPL